MAITLTGAGGLFTRMGKFGKILRTINNYQLNTIGTPVEEAMVQFDAGGDIRTVVDQLPGAVDPHRRSMEGLASTVQTAAINTLLEMVEADNPRPDRTSVEQALVELIKQMNDASATVNAVAVTVSAAALSINSGDGVCVVSTKRGDGLEQENLFAEVSELRCIGDAQSGTGTLAQEPFTWRGDTAETNVFAETWPDGSGAQASLTAVNASEDAGTNLLTNSDFEDFTSNTPDNWTITTGVAGTDIKEEATTVYAGSKALEFDGDGATLSALTQEFDSSTGTEATLLPQTPYAINFWIKADVVPAAGVLTVELIDGTPAVIADDEGVNNAFTVDLTAITTSFVAYNGVFRTPRVLPDTIKLRIRLSTAVSAGSSVFVDHMAMAQMTVLYDGGPAACVFSGATPFVVDDGFNLTTTNDRGGSTLNSTFQTLFDRFFGMKALGLLLPSAGGGAETIADTLITA